MFTCGTGEAVFNGSDLVERTVVAFSRDSMGTAFIGNCFRVIKLNYSFSLLFRFFSINRLPFSCHL